ncbi:histidine kinase [Skermanella stibiiresistens SB22]|uniref:Histidine kinase n=1 Tax=Skermanella stibiiresistens SB22 TaxID=1385369 RepID=W9GVA7_9PROT|nr:CBS domain-containing protein [Skermanella stibiiresistens]EWY37719.1 histidine kinase [Skermanella stibiiresistens SB22]
MHVAAVIKRKGSTVISITPERTIAEAANLLTENRIGAVLVLDGGEGIRGIISERDIVNALSKHGATAMSRRVEEVMTREVKHCSPNDTIAEVMTVMTKRRFRHLPVVDDGKLLGMISIGDVVKQRLDETELEVETLRGYVTGQG